MRLNFIGKHLTLAPGLKAHVEEHLERLSKYYARILSARVVVKQEKYLYVCEVTLKAGPLTLYAEGRSRANLFEAADDAVRKLGRQLERAHDKWHYSKGRARARM